MSACISAYRPYIIQQHLPRGGAKPIKRRRCIVCSAQSLVNCSYAQVGGSYFTLETHCCMLSPYCNVIVKVIDRVGGAIGGGPGITYDYVRCVIR